MPLKETRNGKTTTYVDDDLLLVSRWARLLGCGPSTVEAAARKEEVDVREDGKHRSIRVSAFPKLMRGFQNHYYQGDRIFNRNFNRWADKINTSADFEVRPPSGGVLVYEHQKARSK